MHITTEWSTHCHVQGVKRDENNGFYFGWLDLLALRLQVLLITLKYSAIADLHAFQFTVAHALGFSVFTSRLYPFPGNGFITQEHEPILNTYHVIAIQPAYWRVGRIYRKHSFLYCRVLDRVYRAVAWQRVDQIHYNILADS
jgi:hypothetical protein